jgi:hypothetical protein
VWRPSPLILYCKDKDKDISTSAIVVIQTVGHFAQTDPKGKPVVLLSVCPRAINIAATAIPCWFSCFW